MKGKAISVGKMSHEPRPLGSNMFPNVDKVDIQTIWKYTYDAMHYKHNDEDDDHRTGISIKCS